MANIVMQADPQVGHQYLESRTRQQIDAHWEKRATVGVKIMIDYPKGETLMLAVSLAASAPPENPPF